MDRPRILGINLAFFAVLLLIFQKVSAKGEFQVRLTSFRNDQGRDISGNCCNGDTFSEEYGCTSTCHTYFRICLLEFRNEIPMEPLPKCSYGITNSSFLGNNTFDIENYIARIPIEIGWEGDFSIIIDAWHAENGQRNENPRVLSRLAVQRRQGPNETWTEDFYEDAYHSIDFAYRFKCSENYYGDSCTKLCIPSDNYLGHFTCNQNGDAVCLPGWSGQWCNIAVCVDCIHGSCKADEPGVCQCQSGYRGERCDECIPMNGCAHGTCNVPGECICQPGWGGPLCSTDTNYCVRHTPCENGGSCKNEGPSGFKCYCTPGFTGAYCSIPAPTPECACQNGGTCLHDTARGTICSCPSGTTGQHCEYFVTGCSADLCLNGATCEDIPSGYQCHCRPGFYGNQCERMVDICVSANNPCINGGTCLNVIENGYECLCQEGFSGRHCEVNICSRHTCYNGGTCVTTADSAKCQCAPGFTGESCEIHPNYCDSSPCVNGGSCNELEDGGYFCDCALGFRGKNCEIPECESNFCENGGTCSVDLEGGILCTCAPGYGGALCADQLYSLPRTKVSTTPGSGVLEVPPTKSQSIGEQENNELMLMIVFISFGVAVVFIILLLVVIIYRKHKSDTRKRDVENSGAPPNNRAVLTYRDNLTHEEKVLPLLSISEKVCNKEIETYKAKTTHSRDYSITNSQSVSNSINKELSEFSKKDIKSLRLANDRKTQEGSSSNVVRYEPQSRHSFPRNCESDDFYYYDDKKGQLKRTDSVQTNSQSSSLESTPKHTAKCPVLQISAVVEDTYPSPVRLLASEV